MIYAEAVDHLYALGPELAASARSPDPAIPPPPPPRKYDVAHMRTLCAALGDPHLRVPAVLIAGTNGKGSTAATLASILAAAGYRTGLYTSPHLVRVNERIQLSASPAAPRLASDTRDRATSALTPIADHDFARLYTRVDDVCEDLVAAGALPMLPSFFERLTAVAFLSFAESEARIMVLEVGLGGRLDATNIVHPLLSVITDIALDHQEFLGNTITEIAAEKCGILRESGTLITLPQHPEANLAIGLAATRLHVQAISAADFIPPAQRNTTPVILSEGTGSPSPVPQSKYPDGLRLAAKSPELSAPAAPTHSPTPSPLPRNRYTLNLSGPISPGQLEVDSPLPGHHQQRNIALAIAAAIALRNQTGNNSTTTCNQTSYNITDAAIEAGIRNTVWPGRLEFLPPNLLLDVAHNPAGAWTLRGAIASLPSAQPRTLIFSCLRDKSLSEISRILFPLFDSSPGGDPQRRHDHIILAPIASPRASAVEDLLAAAHALDVPAHAAPHLAAALAQARAITPPGGLIIATGSVYLVGEIRHLALGDPNAAELYA